MIKCLLLISLWIHATIAQKPIVPDPVPVEHGPGGPAHATPLPTKKWLTLNGNEPVVVARGGLSGIFPESGQVANTLSMDTSINTMALFCNLQLTKDGVGICLSGPTLDNATDIASVFPQGEKTYQVNGNPVKGWFSIDFDSNDVFNNISLVQSKSSRPLIFDGQMGVSAAEDIVGLKPPKFWLNVQYNQFYIEHKLSPATFIQMALRGMATYISSPEVGFLKDIGMKINKARTKLFFVIPDVEAVEITTKKKYGDFLKDLASIKAFAAGIVVPKELIYPVDENQYLLPPTNLVNDAHKQGLEVYASGFANDMIGSHNYSYDPTAEYLQFIDNSKFAVDGFLTDFCPTASETIGEFCLCYRRVRLISLLLIANLMEYFSFAACFANNNTKKQDETLVITHNGASGIYPPSTDLAYQKAIDDGADIIDCSVQMSKDGIAFCSDSADLMGSTTAMTMFMDRSTSVPEIQPKNGIFSFDLTWNEIQTVKPQIVSPYGNMAGMQRNPAYKNAGKFTTLAEFLELAKTKAVPGIMISMENAAYLASKKGLDLVGTVTTALTNATLDKQSTLKVLIESSDTSVLSKFASVPAYQKVLRITKQISNVPKETQDEIKKYASAVVISRGSIFTVADGFIDGNTTVVEEMHSANITVYLSVMMNEFLNIPYDMYSDPIIELTTYTVGAGVDGIITEFPGTAAKLFRSPCSNIKAELQYYIIPAEPGAMLGIVNEQSLPPASAPAPVLDVADVIDDPLPAVSKVVNATSDGGAAGAPAPSSAVSNLANFGLSVATVMVLALLN
ncbi:hypothetical protein ACFE04_010918 [Oxalis oulophora]